MFELRNLRHGEKPVSGQEERRRAVEGLVNRVVRSSSNSQDQPTVVQDEAIRPEHITVEVNALIERRPVSSVLQSAAFRRSLENSVRRAVTMFSNHSSTSGPPRSRLTPQPNSAEVGSTLGEDRNSRNPGSIGSRSSLAALSLSGGTSLARLWIFEYSVLSCFPRHFHNPESNFICFNFPIFQGRPRPRTAYE